MADHTSAPHVEIALWGLAGAGKTAMLAYLLHAGIETGWDVRPAPGAEAFVAAIRKRHMFNRFPPPTPHMDIASVHYRMKKGDRVAMLSVEDRPGSSWRELSDTADALRRAQALIVLLEPKGGQHDLENQVRQTFEALCPDDALEQRPVALCLTKVDTLIHDVETLHLAEHDPEAFVTTRVDGRLRRLVANFCANAKFFPVSTVGVRVRHGTVSPAVIADEAMTLRPALGVRPINLTEPFDWIISQVASS